MIIFSPKPPGFQQGVIFLQHWPLVTRLHIPILPENSCSCFSHCQESSAFWEASPVSSSFQQFPSFPKIVDQVFPRPRLSSRLSHPLAQSFIFFLYYSSVQALLMSPVAILYHQLLLPLKTSCEKSLTSLFSYFVLSPSPSAESWPNHHSRNWIWQWGPWKFTVLALRSCQGKDKHWVFLTSALAALMVWSQPFEN